MAAQYNDRELGCASHTCSDMDSSRYPGDKSGANPIFECIPEDELIHPWSAQYSKASPDSDTIASSSSLPTTNPLDSPVIVSNIDLTPFYIYDILGKKLVEDMSPMERYMFMGYPRLCFPSMPPEEKEVLRILDELEIDSKEIPILGEAMISETTTTTTTTTAILTTTTTTTVAIDFAAADSQPATLNLECAYQCTYECGHQYNSDPELIAQHSEVCITMSCPGNTGNVDNTNTGKRKRTRSTTSGTGNASKKTIATYTGELSDSWSVIVDYGIPDDGTGSAEIQVDPECSPIIIYDRIPVTDRIECQK